MLPQSATPRPAHGAMVIARLNARAQPLDRLDLFEAPLEEIPQATGTGCVTGGGTMLDEEGEVAFCDLELTVPETTDAVLGALRTALERMGAPKCSKLIWNDGAAECELGVAEGLAIA